MRFLLCALATGELTFCCTPEGGGGSLDNGFSRFCGQGKSIFNFLPITHAVQAVE
jgi:hypothetical protein